MAEFTARLSDGTAWKVNAGSRAEAEQLARSENARRSRPAPGGGDPVEADFARAGIQVPAERGFPPVGSPQPVQSGGGMLERRPGLPPPGPMNPAQLEALRTMPPPGPQGPMPTPLPSPAPQAPPGMLQQGLGALTPSPSQMRSGIEGTGGMLGMAAGLPGGFPGMMAGGALGGAAGAFLSEAVDPSTSPGEMYKRAGQAASFEALAGPMGEAGAAGIKMGQRALAQLDSQLTSLAEHYGIRLGIEDLSTMGFFNRMRQVIGRFPLLAKPFQEASKRKGSDVLGAIQSQFDGIAPTAADPFLVSRRTISESRAAWEHYREGVNTRYDGWRANAKASGVEFSPNITRRRAEELLGDAGERQATFQKVNPISGEAMVTKGRLQPDPLARVAERITNLGDNQSVAVYDALRKDLQGMQTKLKSPNDRARVGALLEGLELDLRSTLSSADSARELAQADRFLKKGKVLFESATANRIGQFRANIFEVGKTPEATSLDIGNAVRTVFQTGNRQAVSEYRHLVGEQTFRQATRLHLQDSFQSAFRVVETGADAGKISLDMGKLSKDLGLFDPKSERRAALVKMLQGTSVDVRDIENVVRLANVAMRAGPVDVSQFASRRAVIGGLESALGSFTPGAGGGSLKGQILKTLTTLIEGRRFGRWLTDPRAVKNLQIALNPNLQQSARTAAMIRFGRMIERDQSMGGFEVPAAASAGFPMGAAMQPPSLVQTPLGALRGALQAGVGAKLSQATAAPFRGNQ